MITTFSDLDIIARTLYGEARGEVATIGLIGLEAVASVVWNRWRSNPAYFGKTPRDVCLKPYQFSCWNRDDPNLKVLLQPIIHDGTYALCRMVAEEFLAGRGSDVVNGSDHYHAVWMSPPSWAQGKNPEIDIGSHRFYRLYNM
jgi:spore germination cell wall hydrolase CwlJ-like protein